jgi:hypothetical protein
MTIQQTRSGPSDLRPDGAAETFQDDSRTALAGDRTNLAKFRPSLHETHWFIEEFGGHAVRDFRENVT